MVQAMIGADKKFEVEALDKQYNLLPMNDKIVVRRAGPKASPSGLTLPENMKGTSIIEGEVVVTGPGTPTMSPPATNPGLRRPMMAKAGDKILFHKASGHDIEINGEKLTVMNENDIMVILTPVK
jgi:co-chaperonin GroES (HSP10)